MIGNRGNVYCKLIMSLVALTVLTSCVCDKGSQHNINLLSIQVNGEENIKHEPYNRRLEKITLGMKDTANLYAIFSELFFSEKAHYSVMAINKIKHDSLNLYSGIMIFDNIPDDDSVSGYRYNVKFKRNPDSKLEIIEVKQSWRCWEDRGHRDFSIASCS